jgi:membrane protein
LNHPALMDRGDEVDARGDGLAHSANGRTAELRMRLSRSLVGQVWDRMLEVEFLDRSVALAGKAFVSFFPLVIVVMAFVPDSLRTPIRSAVLARFGLEGDALTLAREAFSSTNDVREATGVLGLVLALLFATSFTLSLQRCYLRTWRRPPGAGARSYWRGALWLLAILTTLAALGALRGVLDGGAGALLFAILSLAVVSGLWWFTAWLLLFGEVRARVLAPTGVITSLVLTGYAASAAIWMPKMVTHNEAQFGFFGIALALVTWFSGAAVCVVLGMCAGAVLAEDTGRVGRSIRGGDMPRLTPGAPPDLPPPARPPRLRDAIEHTDER